MKTLEKLPDIRNRINTNEHFIDATPKGYALRILRYYRDCCDQIWEVSGVSEEKSTVYDLMNEQQKQRAKELDKAIEVLEGIHSPLRY